MREGVCQCGLPVVRGEDGELVHDATLAELVVTQVEVERALENAEYNKRLARGARRYDSLHRAAKLPQRIGVR